MQTIARKNIKLQNRINFLSGITFLIGIITLFYRYTGLSLVQIILLANVGSFTVFLFDLPTSIFADIAGRKKALVISVICNLASSLFIIFFPSLPGFIIAAIFSGLYFAFWNGTGQSFLEENLKIIGEENTFGKKLGNLFALGTLAGIITTLMVSGILKIWGDHGYIILAVLDSISAGLLVILTLQLKEVITIRTELESLKLSIIKHYQTIKTALKNVFTNKTIRTLLIYRSLANHVAFLYIISLPIRVENGMQPWMAGIFGMFGALAMLISNKYGYKLGEKYSYNLARVVSTICQAVLLIIAGLFLKSWILITVIMILFNFFEGLWMPAWRQVLGKQMDKNGFITARTTIRSVIFTVFALYTTIGKQFLSRFPVNYALIGLGVFIIIVNIVLGRKILKLKE